MDNLKDLEVLKIKDDKFPNLVLLHYMKGDTGEDPKTFSARGHIVLETQDDSEPQKYVCRPFDRFFNLSETNDTIDIREFRVYEKVDGTLIKVYNYKGCWYCGTRKSFDGTNEVDNFEITFKDLFFRALNIKDYEEFQVYCKYLNPSCTYLFELTCYENTVVIKPQKDTVYFLAARDNESGEYLDIENLNLKGTEKPKEFKVQGDVTQWVDTIENIEGVVLYKNFEPKYKVKTQEYIKLHHQRHNGILSDNDIIKIICDNEENEFLSYFEQFKERFEPFIELKHKMFVYFEWVFNSFKHLDKKEFALSVSVYGFKAVLFEMYKGHSLQEIFERYPLNFKIKIFKEFIESESLES